MIKEIYSLNEPTIQKLSYLLFKSILYKRDDSLPYDVIDIVIRNLNFDTLVSAKLRVIVKDNKGNVLKDSLVSFNDIDLSGRETLMVSPLINRFENAYKVEVLAKVLAYTSTTYFIYDDHLEKVENSQNYTKAILYENRKLNKDIFKYKLYSSNNYWRCCCGEVNSNITNVCLNCGLNKDFIKEENE